MTHRKPGNRSTNSIDKERCISDWCLNFVVLYKHFRWNSRWIHNLWDMLWFGFGFSGVAASTRPNRMQICCCSCCCRIIYLSIILLVEITGMKRIYSSFCSLLRHSGGGCCVDVSTLRRCNKEWVMEEVSKVHAEKQTKRWRREQLGWEKFSLVWTKNNKFYDLFDWMNRVK